MAELTLDHIEKQLKTHCAKVPDFFEVYWEGDQLIACRLEPMFPDDGFTEEYDMVLFEAHEGQVRMHAVGTWRAIRAVDRNRLGPLVVEALTE